MQIVEDQHRGLALTLARLKQAMMATVRRCNAHVEEANFSCSADLTARKAGRRWPATAAANCSRNLCHTVVSLSPGCSPTICRSTSRNNQQLTVSARQTLPFDPLHDRFEAYWRARDEPRLAQPGLTINDTICPRPNCGSITAPIAIRPDVPPAANACLRPRTGLGPGGPINAKIGTGWLLPFTSPRRADRGETRAGLKPHVADTTLF
jgi:hypothetical protein